MADLYREVAKLCAICRTIPFDGLILPFVSETDNADQNDDARNSGFYDMGKERSMTRVHFGLMSRVLQNEEGCEFCAMIAAILRRHSTSPYGPQEKLNMSRIDRPYYENLAEKADRPCEVKVMWYLGIKHPLVPSRSRWAARLLINWKDDRGSQHGAYSCFQTLYQKIGDLNKQPVNNDPFSHELLCGGRHRPLAVNLDWIRKWIHICAREHSSECSLPVSASNASKTKIRLVDVRRMCLIDQVDLSKGVSKCQYMALSYVWGSGVNTHKFSLLSSNHKTLRQPGSIKKDDLSLTLADFLTLAQSLNIPYIWVDALCIFQDDREDKIVQIAAMNAIYQNAFITVVAANGDNLDSGLAGIRPNSRTKLPKEITIRLADLDRQTKDGKCDYITLIETLNHPEHTAWTPLTSTIWNSRAWTYQERMLSRRALIFTKEQLYWACNEASFCEEVCLEFPQHKITYHAGFVNPIESSFHTTFKEIWLNGDEAEQARSRVWKGYKIFVTHYSKRFMKYEGDVYAAFAGILQAVSERSQDEFLMGHPRSRFEHGLAWSNFKSIRRRVDKSALPMTAHGIRITMPSWSWMGWHGEVNFNVTEEKEFDGNSPEVECFTHRTSPLRLVPVRSHASSTDFKEDKNWFRLPQKCPTLKEIERAHPTLTAGQLSHVADETILFFWASTSRFRVQYPNMVDYDVEVLAEVNRAEKPKIFNARGDVIGELQQLEEAPQLEAADGMADFIVVERHTPDPEMAQLLGTTISYEVLQLGWRLDRHGDKGLCMERVNIGTVKKSDWLKSKPQMKLIALQ